MSFPSYSEYKDSGFLWLGEIPTHWSLLRLGQLFSERRERASDTEFEPLSVTKNGIVPRLESAAKTQDGDNRKKVLTGDFVINSRSDRKGSSGLSLMDGSVSLICTVITPSSGIHGSFAHHLLRSEPFQEEYYRWGKGIVADLWSTNFSDMKNIVLGIPSYEEQTQIARFLDHETTRIDTLIEEQQRLIELLKEKRQAIISHAVTKGLNPNVPMKDSSVEWLGEVPAHWEVKKLGYIGQARNGLTYSPDNIVEDSDSGTLVLRSSNIQSAKISLLDNVYVNSRIPDNLRVRESDILICSRNGSRALIGKNALIPKELDGQSFGAFMMIFRSKINNFIYWVLNSPIFDCQSSSFLTATINQLTNDNLTGMLIPLPPLTEQEEIVQYLNEKTSEIDFLIDEVKSGIDFLKERRSALISAAVTGKIDVRGWQPQASTPVPSLEREKQ